jgi:hypothetical protein
MEITAITALAASAGALTTSAFAIFKWREEFTAREEALTLQSSQWWKTFESERRTVVGDWQIQFLRELVLRRLATYPPVLQSLASVRYYGEDEPLDLDPRQVPRTAEELLAHLYGEAGLVMSPTARDCVHRAMLACRHYQSRPDTTDELINSFYDARHHLRADIQIADSSSFDTALNEMSHDRLTASSKSKSRFKPGRVGTAD